MSTLHAKNLKKIKAKDTDGTQQALNVEPTLKICLNLVVTLINVNTTLYQRRPNKR